MIEPGPDESPEDAAKRIVETTELSEFGRVRCLEILFAWMVREECSKRIAAKKDKREKGALRKATYFLGWLIKTASQDKISEFLENMKNQAPHPTISKNVEKLALTSCATWFDKAVAHFNTTVKKFIQASGGNEDSTLKNTNFVKELGEGWPKKEKPPSR